MRVRIVSERVKLILLFLLIAVLALEIAPLIPANRLPQFCLFARVKGEITRWEIDRDTTVLRFKHPTHRAVEEWRSSGISDEVIFSNLISMPDYACDPVTGDVVYSIPKILRWNALKLPREYRASSFREAWTYALYDPKTRSSSTQFELKPLPAIRERPRYRKYENYHNKSPMGFLRIPDRLASEILQHPLENISVEEATALFWEEVFNSNRPVILTEGAKKAASLLSHGFIGISIPRFGLEFDRNGPSPSASLTDGLMPLFRNKRTIYLAFDNDANPKLRYLVHTARALSANLIEKEGADVRLIDIPGKTKGIDDFAFAHGREALSRLMSQAPKPSPVEDEQSELADIAVLAHHPIWNQPLD